MKGMKKLLSILMVLTLVLSLGAMAFAAEGTHMTTVTIHDAKTADEAVTHTYVAYQIFTGTQADGTSDRLASIEWAENFDDVGFLAALKASENEAVATAFASCTTADEVATALGSLDGNMDALREFGQLAKANHGTAATYTLNGEVPQDLPIGYYAIIDETEELGDSVRNDVVLQVVGSAIDVKFKADVPSSDKKVKDKADSDSTDMTGWQNSADWDIGDEVPFMLEATIPHGTTNAFEKYELTFHDHEDPGLTFDSSSVKVYVNNKLVETGYEIKKPGGEDSDPCTFEIYFKDIKTLDNFTEDDVDDVIRVEYNSVLNKDAVIGVNGNLNEMYLEFSNDNTNGGTGTTPEKTVIVFTFDLDVEKVDQDKEPLEGAGFTLYKYNAETEEYEEVNHDGATPNAMVTEGEDGKFTVNFKGLDDGKYKLVETTVPDGYNKAADVEFTIVAGHVAESNAKMDAGKLEITGVSEGAIVQAKEDGSGAQTSIQNNQGVELPETGGIGTTIFYIAGAILVAGAVIILVTKKRVSGAEK